MSATYAEIGNQPRAWEQTVQLVPEQWGRLGVSISPHTHFLLAGSGTSLYLAHSAARALQEVTGRVAVAVPSSEVFLAPGSTVPSHVPVVAFVISRSGTTSEAVLAARHLADSHPNVTVIGVTCNTNTELAAVAHYTLELPFASEDSVVMTQSFTTMLLALQLVAGSTAGDQRFLDELARVPDLGAANLDRYEQFGGGLGENQALRQVIFLGLGAAYGLAEEGSLKLKEMTQVPCEAYNPLEFRHGPISIVEAGTAAILLHTHSLREYAASLESDLQARDSYVATLSPYAPAHSDAHLSLPDDLSDLARGVLYMPALQFLAYYRARMLGLDPDRPRNLTQVVRLDAC